MKGKLYGVGVGPGDPKLMTYLAVETLENCQVLAIPADGKEKSIAYKIANGICKNLDEKEYLDISTPMTKDPEVLEQNQRHAAEIIAAELEKGKDVAFPTLGDPTIYSTYIYISRIVQSFGFETEIVSGITSFCASAARLNDSLVDTSEPLHVIPSSYGVEDALKLPGTKVLMKAGSKMPMVKETIRKNNLRVRMVENCGMETEKIYNNVDEIPDKASYYSLIVIKEEEKA